jgi:hypothetical protein
VVSAEDPVSQRIAGDSLKSVSSSDPRRARPRRNEVWQDRGE